MILPIIDIYGYAADINHITLWKVFRWRCRKFMAYEDHTFHNVQLSISAFMESFA